jgi:DNA-binding Xre family transcriptional regulator
MDLNVIRKLSEKYDGGLKKLSSDIGMSEANLHRCINNNKIQASDLEAIAIRLGVDVRIFFDEAAVKYDSHTIDCKTENIKSHELLELCKDLVANYQQRDTVMSKLVSMVKGMET